MADINSLVLSGRLTRDSELTYTEAGMAILKFGLANNRRVKKMTNGWIMLNFLIVLSLARGLRVLLLFLRKENKL